VHFQGLQQTQRFYGRRLATHTLKKLLVLDQAYAIARHITNASSNILLLEIQEEMVEGGALSLGLCCSSGGAADSLTTPVASDGSLEAQAPAGKAPERNLVKNTTLLKQILLEKILLSSKILSQA